MALEMLTKTKTDPVNGHVYIVEYGFDEAFAVRHSQRPSLSVTGEHWTGTPMRLTERNLVSMGCMHDMVREQFPELASLLPFHMATAPDGEPLHYFASARHWWEHVNGMIARHSWHEPEEDTAEKGRRYFRDLVCADVPGVGPVGEDVFDFTPDELHRWLSDRLPLIRDAMREACLAAGVGWPEAAPMST